MPVTKKKGAIFGIYTDSPDRAATSSSSKPAPRSPSKRTLASSTSTTSTRRVLSSLQPRPVSSASSSASHPNIGMKGKPLSSAGSLKGKDVPLKGKSTLEIYSDPAESKPRSTSRASSSNGAQPGGKPLRRAPTPLAPLSLAPPSQPLSTKRSRDLLSPLPIFADPKENTAVRPTTRSASGQSPAKRGRHTPSTSLSAGGAGGGASSRTFDSPVTRRMAALSAAAAAKSSSSSSSSTPRDKENVAPSAGLEGSPATRTRSKVRSQDINLGFTLSPLRLGDTPQGRRRSEVERLVGDGLGISGRVLSGSGAGSGSGSRRHTGMGAGDDGGSPKGAGAKGEGKIMAGKGKGMMVLPDGALADVSEAYGARGDAPEGFASQRRS
ncbi:hypothetical protein IAT38_000306 [Cryptococcus sp. DSM 104549]